MRITPNFLIACLLLQGWLFTNFTCKYLRRVPDTGAASSDGKYLGSGRGLEPCLSDAEWKRRATAAAVGGVPVRQRAREAFVRGRVVDARVSREWIGDIPLVLISLGFITVWCMTLSAFLFDNVMHGMGHHVIHVFRPHQDLAHRHVISTGSCKGG